MTEETSELTRRVILPDAQGKRKPFMVEPTVGDMKRAQIKLSAEDRAARPKYEWPDER